MLQVGGCEIHPGYEYFFLYVELGAELYEKLVAGVENALRCQLTQIDEDSFESEF